MKGCLSTILFHIAMIDDLYNSKILQAAAHITHVGRLGQPDATSKKRSPLCGSTILVDMNVADGVVRDFAQEVRACVLGQAAAALVAEEIVGTTTQQLKQLRRTILAMLKEAGSPPQGKFTKLAILQPVRDFKARHGSVLLIFDAVVDCIEQIEAKESIHDKTPKM